VRAGDGGDVKQLGFLITAIASAGALSCLALSGCGSSGGNGNGPPSDAAPDTTAQVGDSAADGSSTDAGVGVTPCAVDASLLTPVDAAGSPLAAACMACLEDTTTMVPALYGSGTCSNNLVACNENCACKSAVTNIGDCLDGGGTSAMCLLELLNVDGGKIPPLSALIGCEQGPCHAACTTGLSSDGGRSDAGDGGHASDAGDGGSAPDAGDAGQPEDGGDAAASDAAADSAAASDAAAEDASDATTAADSSAGDDASDDATTADDAGDGG
jgi:hypothetical protein